MRLIQRIVSVHSNKNASSVYMQRGGSIEEILASNRALLSIFCLFYTCYLAVLPIIYLIIFIIVVFKYIRTGILVVSFIPFNCWFSFFVILKFAWLNIIQVISIPVIIILEIIAISQVFSSTPQRGSLASFIIIRIIVAVLAIILSVSINSSFNLFSDIFFQIFTIIASFKLAKLLKQTKIHQLVWNLILLLKYK